MPVRPFIYACCLQLLLIAFAAPGQADDFDQFLKPLFAQKCIKCHGEDKVNGEVNLKQINTATQFLQQPELIANMIQVVDASDMPPEGAPQLEDDVRTKLLATLKEMLRVSTSGAAVPPLQIRRLNRFQYNNAVRDLFQLKSNVFPLPEKLMTRHSNYLNSAVGKMPDRVSVASLSLNPNAGLRDVNAFPKDLRAAHGFDNQANQLTLSPLLLDAFLKLSVSILESPDFNSDSVGIWNDFFSDPPADADTEQEVRNRLKWFLEIAFRSPVEPETLERYTAYTHGKIQQGLTFTDSMKKVASAVLSSPLFLYRSESAQGDQYKLATNLSFFLWGSGPDSELLQLAASGELSKPEFLNHTIERMLTDPRIERFLDTFPGQWMQLENVLAATPDPQKHRYFSLEKNNPASLQMLLEPLLLFDAVFVEDRPIVELIAPKFGYQSEFLKTWYTTDLQPPQVDVARIVDDNRRHEKQRTKLTAVVQKTEAELDTLIKPVQARLMAERSKAPESQKPVDLKPYAAWEFAGDLKDSVSSLDLTAHGDIQFKDGMVVLEKSYLLSAALPIDLKAKSLEVWCRVHDLGQSGGGVMGIQGPGDFFDTIVLGERKPQHWISGSNGFSRTLDFPDSTPETTVNDVLHLVMVYTKDGTTTLYRNGIPYGKPYRKDAATFPQNASSVIFGLRHLPPGGNKFLSVSLDKARLYTRALSAKEVAASANGNSLYISDEDLLQAMSPEQTEKMATLNKTLEQSQTALKNVPVDQDPKQAQQDARKLFEDEMRKQLRESTFERVAATDPRYGGVITSAAMLSMTSGPNRTHPIARGAWIIEVIFNDPPPPPPNDVPPLNEEASAENLTIREKFARHRENPDCASCHSRLDPLGFALENFDITGRWRNKYENGREVDSSGTLMKKYDFKDIVEFKQSLVHENRRFARAFTAHLLRFAISRELGPADSLVVDAIVEKTEDEQFRLKSLIREVVLSDSFLHSK